MIEITVMLAPSGGQKVSSDPTSVGAPVELVGEPPPLPPLTMATKAESVASITSQCSFSSTIVHVGDKKPPESGGNGQNAQTQNPEGLCVFILPSLIVLHLKQKKNDRMIFYAEHAKVTLCR